MCTPQLQNVFALVDKMSEHIAKVVKTTDGPSRSEAQPGRVGPCARGRAAGADEGAVQIRS